MVFVGQGVLMMAAAVMLAPGLQETAAPAAAPAPVVADAAPPKEKKICRRWEVSGSLFPKTACRTKREWAEVDAANLANALQIRDRNKLLGAGQE